MTKPITLEDIKAQQSKLSEMIAEYESQPKTDYIIPRANIVLDSGERYAGIVLNNDGNPVYHLILLPGEKEGIEWAAANGWAADQGGELPTRRAQLVLLANLGDQFAGRYYWASEQHDECPEYAWCLHFGKGIRNLTQVSSELVARAVRRVYI